ncbi:MAG TPA: lysine biosynthesis protein LysW [Anaerolineae bacterium]|nr:lysine biosynthesis protein LysW [Anaerolineae bacterium]
MSMAICPSCEGEIKLTRKVELGQRIRCPLCLEDLEVVETNPVELDWAYDEEEEWDDEWEEEEEEAEDEDSSW